MLMLKNRGGFTLFEVMITMAISGSMLMIAVITFGGQQRKTQFNQSLRSISSQISDSINDTATGYFPFSTKTCTGGGIGRPTFLGGSPEAGTNIGCVFLGKALVFGKSKVDSYPVVGNSALTATTFSTAHPTLVAEVVESKEYQWGAELYDVLWPDNTSHKDTGGMLLFVSSPNGTGTAANGRLNSGIQRVNSYSSGNPAVDSPSINSQLNNTYTTGTDVVDNSKIEWWPPGDSVTLCFQDSASGSPGRQHGGVVVEGGSKPISARLQLDSDTPGCP